MGSRRALSWVMVHEGVMRRSDDEFSDVMSSGTSWAVEAIGRSLFLLFSSSKYTEMS